MKHEHKSVPLGQATHDVPTILRANRDLSRLAEVLERLELRNHDLPMCSSYFEVKGFQDPCVVHRLAIGIDEHGTTT